jgi:FixJ family two-component response regulator
MFDHIIIRAWKRVAGELATAEKTVKVHRGRVMHKGRFYFGTGAASKPA